MCTQTCYSVYIFQYRAPDCSVQTDLKRASASAHSEWFGKHMPKEKTILVIGACALDRILHLESYPTEDTKTGCSQSFEYGGGNAANTASTMARLADSGIFRDACDHKVPIKVKLLSKVGNDMVKKKVCAELEEFGVDISSPLFKVGPKGSSTPVATVLVTTLKPHSRTCIYDKGTCGVLTAQDIQNSDLDEIFSNVVHFHSDSRHTEAAALLATEAQRRKIPVSVDVERDRYSKAFDDLIKSASIIFTNENKMSCTLERRLNMSYFRNEGKGDDLLDVCVLCHALWSFPLDRSDCSREAKELVVTLYVASDTMSIHL